jgi:hypothetical protein
MLSTLSLLPFWLANGLLVSVYWLLDHAVFLGVCPPLIWWALTCAPEQQGRTWTVAGLVLVAVACATPPVPVILLVMAWAGAFAIWQDRFAPNTLRVHLLAGLGAEALAALGVAGAWAYLNTLTPNQFGALFAVGNAGQLLAQGKDTLQTLSVWGTWFIVPLGYLGLIVQGLFVHAPPPATPEQLIARVRTRQ